MTYVAARRYDVTSHDVFVVPRQGASEGEWWDEAALREGGAAEMDSIHECLREIRLKGELTVTDLEYRKATGRRTDIHEVRVLTDESELYPAWEAGFRPVTP